MQKSLKELLTLLLPIDRAVLFGVYRAGGRVDRGVSLPDVKRFLSDTDLGGFDATARKLSSHPFSFISTLGADLWFFTPLGLRAFTSLVAADVSRPIPVPPKLPFTPENPRRRPFSLERAFEEDIKRIARDGNLRRPLQKKFEHALLDFGRAKMLGTGVYKGCRSDHVARNFRLLYRVAAETVVFVRFLPKDDPHYKE